MGQNVVQIFSLLQGFLGADSLMNFPHNLTSQVKDPKHQPIVLFLTGNQPTLWNFLPHTSTRHVDYSKVSI